MSSLALGREPKEHTIKFENPVFETDLNVTIRNGPKWADTLGLGDVLEWGDPYGMYGRVVGVAYVSLEEAPSALLELNHDPACRTREGLKATLDRLYGLSKRRMVTVILFNLRQWVS